MVAVHVASTQQIRAHFPAIQRRHHGLPVAYFDGPGGTQAPKAVVEAMNDYLYRHNANTHWNYPSSAETDQVLAQARQTLADFFNAVPQEVVFGSNMTSLTFHLSRALGAQWGADTELVVTELDHHANVDPWKRLCKERGITVRTVKMNSATGQLDWEDLRRCLMRKTKLLAIGAASNALGTVSDVARAAEMAHAVGALIFVDAVHFAPHHLLDVRALDCDFLVCSAYKFYGPHLGVLYGKRTLLEVLDAPKLMPAADAAPERLETGTQNHEGIAGAAAAVDYVASLAAGNERRPRLQSAFEALHERGQRLLERLWEGLAHIPGVKLFGPEPDQPRTPTVSFVVGSIPSAEVSRRLAERGLFLSHGDFYAATVVQRLGVAEQGLVRAGCACYTTPEEVERLLDGVRRIVQESGMI